MPTRCKAKKRRIRRKSIQEVEGRRTSEEVPIVSDRLTGLNLLTDYY